MVIVEEAANPVPDTVTMVPTDLVEGARAMEAILTVKVAEAELAPVSVAVTV